MANTVITMDKVENDVVREPMISVIDTIHDHVRILSGNLRERDMEIANRVGIPAHLALWRIYRKSLMCKTVVVDNQIVAIWGICGTFLGKTGKPWLVASPFVEDYPMKVAFRYRSELRNMLKYFTVLEDFVNVDDEKTIRLLEILGFKFEEPKSFNNVMFMRATLEK